MKNCPYCGQENPNENQFCNRCGKDMVNIPQTDTRPAQQAYASMPQIDTPQVPQAPVQQPTYTQTPLQQAYMPPVPTVRKKIKWWAILGLLSGVSASGSGILTLIKQPYIYMSSYSYGGDFYTNTSEQLQDIGRYLQNISEILSTGLGCLLIALGMFMIWHFVGKLIDK